MTKQDFINNYWESAIEACLDTPIFPLLALAESAVESAWGESELTKEANNFLGIKSSLSWEEGGGSYVVKKTREVIDGKPVMVNAKFRKYPTPADCYKNYVHFVTQPNYVSHGVLVAKTPEEQVTAIAAAGYATDPDYAHKIISVMNGLRPLLPNVVCRLPAA